MEDLTEPFKAKIAKMNRQISIYQEAIEYYANPLSPVDGGEVARRAILNLSNPHYKYNRLKDFVFRPIFNYEDESYE